jgi:hypothetical protein
MKAAPRTTLETRKYWKSAVANDVAWEREGLAVTERIPLTLTLSQREREGPRSPVENSCALSLAF